MRRALVLTDEVTRHPFRRRFLEHAVPGAPKQELGDVGFFVMSFVSGFIIIFGMIV